MRVEQAGFATYQHCGIALPTGQTVHLDLTLIAGTAAAEVTVTEQPSAIDASQIASTTIVDTERIEELPVRSRNYLAFVLLAPGVATGFGQPVEAFNARHLRFSIDFESRAASMSSGRAVPLYQDCNGFRITGHSALVRAAPLLFSTIPIERVVNDDSFARIS